MAAPVRLPICLKVWQVDTQCLFELSWGQGQTLAAELEMPPRLQSSYHAWQEAYQAHYQAMTRAIVKTQGGGHETLINPKRKDWRSALAQREAELLSVFQHWLDHANLSHIRQILVQQVQLSNHHAVPEIFLRCSSQFLAGLPWEFWAENLSKEALPAIALIRRPFTQTDPPIFKSQSRQTRVLAIFGDETGLNFQLEQRILKSLPRWITVECLQSESIQNDKSIVLEKIQDEAGWDFLFFAGHSHDTNLTGGALALSPGESILLRELEGALKGAISRGLKGAFFNSCNGLSLAEACLDMGLSQVIVFREPIHNRVAQLYFKYLIQGLVRQQTLQSALEMAREQLKSARMNYPSAYLVPSYFRHPHTPPLSFSSPSRLGGRRPNWKQAIALGVTVTLSLLPSVQGTLLESRLWAQAVYRQVTGQQGVSSSPPVLLVQVDRESLRRNRVLMVTPMLDRSYLAQIVDQVRDFNPQVLGLNYYLDRPQGEGDRQLYQALQRISTTSQVVVPITLEQPTDLNSWLYPLPEIVPLTGRVGDNDLFLDPVPLNRLKGDTSQVVEESPLPAPYGIEIAEALSPSLSQEQYTLHPLTRLSYWFGQTWLHPVIDFSIDPKQVYQAVSAWEILETGRSPLQNAPIILISAGGYGETLDQFSAPAAIRFWRSQSSDPRDYASPGRLLTGGEVHAYLIDQHLNQRQVVPIPDVWVIIATWLGLSLLLSGKKVRSAYWGTGSLLYGGISLQLYISAAIILPILLPLASLMLYRSLGSPSFQLPHWRKVRKLFNL